MDPNCPESEKSPKSTESDKNANTESDNGNQHNDIDDIPTLNSISSQNISSESVSEPSCSNFSVLSSVTEKKIEKSVMARKSDKSTSTEDDGVIKFPSFGCKYCMRRTKPNFKLFQKIRKSTRALSKYFSKSVYDRANICRSIGCQTSSSVSRKSSKAPRDHFVESSLSKCVTCGADSDKDCKCGESDEGMIKLVLFFMWLYYIKNY